MKKYKSHKILFKSVNILLISLGLSLLPCNLLFVSANTDTVNVTVVTEESIESETNMESSPSSSSYTPTLITLGSTADLNLPKISTNPNLDEIDEKYSKCRDVDIREITISQIQTLFQTEQLTSSELTECYLKRIEKMDSVLHAVIEVNPDAINDAKVLDEEFKSGQSRGPMHGIPVLLKEGIGTFGSMETTAGSPALIGIRPKQDADVVKALRKAGAIILGKANLSEFYWFRGSNIPNGWSGRGGQTRNAYNLNVTPEGSSSGSAVAVAANLCAVSLGSETDGSMVAPANLAGIFAMKPSFGLVSVNGVIPVSRSQDSVGPMARTASDIAIALDAMVPLETRPSQHPPSYIQQLIIEPLNRPLRIGVLRHPFWNTSVLNSTNLLHQLPKLENLLLSMKNSSNFEIIDPVEITEKDFSSKISLANELIMLKHNFKHDLNEYLSNDVTHPTNTTSGKPILSLKDVIQYNDDHPTPEGYNQEYLIQSEATDGILNETYIKARDINRAGAKQLLDSVFENYNLDAVVTPSDSQPEGISSKSFEDFPNFGFSIACIAGYPSINVPAGIGLKEVPFGITFTGKYHAEPTLLKIAHTYERLLPQRKPPKFLI